MRQFRWITNSVGFVLALALTSAPVLAATIPVNTTDDDGVIDGDCELREAILAANTDAAVDACPAGSGTDEITLPAGTYTLTPGLELDIMSDVTITGAGTATTIIDANSAHRVVDIAGPAMVGISSLTIRRGREWTGVGGGGIRNLNATLTLTGVIIETCDAPGGSGGGILNNATVNLVNGTVRDNMATWTGGGIENTGGAGTVSLTNSTVSGNIVTLAGGGIWSNGAVNLTESTLAGNRTSSNGGGIWTSGTLSLTDSGVSDNEAGSDGGGVWNSGTATFTDSMIDGNSCGSNGGGIHNTGGGTVTATNTTISGNTAEGGEGGGLYNTGSGTMTLTNTTVASNSAVTQGGGLHIVNGTVTLQNTIVANNTTGADCSGAALTSSGNNLDSDGTCGFAAAGDLSSVDPLLGALADNGGGTLTHDLLSGSPAVDAGDNAAAPAADQRGITRPNDGNGDGTATADIGAVEQLIDCNTNGTHDAADLAGGASADCDANGVPDECQPDTDGDAIIDACEGPCGCGATSAVLMSFWVMCAAKLIRRRRMLCRAVRQ